MIRFNAKFHEEANRRWQWRDWLYPIEKEAATGLTFANSIVDIKQRARGLENTDLISKTAERKGYYCGITGHALGGSASALELAQNGIVVLIARKKGFSPRQSVAYVRDGIKAIDVLLAERERLVIADSSSEEHSVRVLQGRLLKHIRNQVIFQFTQWSVSSREVEWRENTFYALDALQNLTSMASTIVSKQGLTNSNLDGAASISSLVAHSIETVNPIIRTAAGSCIGHYQRWRLHKIFPQEKPRTMTQLLSDWQELDQLSSISNPHSDALKELAFLVRKSQNFDGPLANEVKKIEHLRRVADQQAISGPLIGLTKVADSTGNVVAHYGYSSEANNNKIKLGAKISDASGEAYSLIATPTAKILHYRYTRKLASEGKLPSQIMQARLEKLDQLEKKIKTAQL